MLDTVKKRSTFLELRNNGEAFFSKSLILQKKNFENNQVDSPKFGFTVSRKVGCAVVRNKIKRRLKHIMRDIMKENVVDSSIYVFIARKYCSSTSFENLNNEAIRLFNKSQSIVK